jgi:hypothetical protein
MGNPGGDQRTRSKAKGDETYVERIERECVALVALFRRNWKLGIVVSIGCVLVGLRMTGLLPTDARNVSSAAALISHEAGAGPANGSDPDHPGPAAESFSYLDGPLPGAIWSAFGTRGFLVRNKSAVVSPGPQQYVVSAKLDLPDGGDQYSEAVVDAPRDSNESWVGVACRISPHGYYGYGISGTSRELYKIIEGRYHGLKVKSDPRTDRRAYVSSLIRLECRGSQLRATVDNVLDFLETDSEITTGRSGLTGYAYPMDAGRSGLSIDGVNHPYSDGENRILSWRGGRLLQ